MTEWQRLHMRDVMLEFHDGPHATPAPADSGPVFLGIKNITDSGALTLSDIRHIAEEDYARWTRRVTPEPGDVVFTYEATLHRYAVIPEGFRGCLGRRLALIRPDAGVVLPRFLHYFMLGPIWRSTVEERTISGATVDRVPINRFDEFPIVLPDLTTQRATVEVLGAIDDLIENNRRRVEVLEETAQAIYREWFVRFRYPGHEDVPLVDSILGPIPKGWSMRAVGDLVTVDKGLSYKGEHLTGSGVPMANLKCFRPGGGFRRDGPKRYGGPFQAKHRVGPGDLIVANTDLTQAGSVIGSPAHVPRRGFDAGGIISHHVYAVRSGDPRLLAWLFETFQDERFRDHARSVASGTTVLGLRPADLLAFLVVCPPTPLLDRFSALASDISLTVESLNDAIDELGALRDLLLPKLVTGAIDVSKLDLDALVAEAVA